MDLLTTKEVYAKIASSKLRWEQKQSWRNATCQLIGGKRLRIKLQSFEIYYPHQKTSLALMETQYDLRRNSAMAALAAKNATDGCTIMYLSVHPLW